MNVIEKITEAVEILNEIDQYESGLGQLLSEYDEREQDLLHFIENNKINVLWCFKYTKELKTIREKRRIVKNDMEIIRKFNEHKTKLVSTIENRKILLQEINKRIKQLNCPYKNRRYKEEEIEKILKGV